MFNLYLLRSIWNIPMRFRHNPSPNIHRYYLTSYIPLEKYVLEPWEQNFPNVPDFMSSKPAEQSLKVSFFRDLSPEWSLGIRKLKFLVFPTLFVKIFSTKLPKKYISAMSFLFSYCLPQWNLKDSLENPGCWLQFCHSCAAQWAQTPDGGVYWQVQVPSLWQAPCTRSCLFIGCTLSYYLQ